MGLIQGVYCIPLDLVSHVFFRPVCRGVEKTGIRQKKVVHTASFRRFLRILGPFLEKDRNPKTLVLEKNFRPKKVMTFCKKNFFLVGPPQNPEGFYL